MKPHRHAILLILAVILGFVALRFGLFALHGFRAGSWPSWLNEMVRVVFIGSILWIWGVFALLFRRVPPAAD